MPVERYSSAQGMTLDRNGEWVYYQHYRRLKKRLDAADARIAELEMLLELRQLIEMQLIKKD